MWTEEKLGKQFLHGKTSPELAVIAASDCGRFVRDDEEECISEDCSCYNCRYRRWTKDSFECMREGVAL